MFVIGTAGHVDHGKSTLVEALTGIDPDRLHEEKARGLTIDLGFAWMSLPNGTGVSVVDVPGHERFIANMLAGVGGIDLALLVVAADESVMPQTLEHLAILDLLQVSRGLVAVTKRDLVENELLELVISEVAQTVEGTTLAGSQILPVSVATGEGLDALIAAIATMLTGATPRRNLGRARLPIDRSFAMTGSGTVVTGTLIDGSLSIGDKIIIQPSGMTSRIRGIQTHKSKLETAPPGTRVAVNLVGISRKEIQRGDVLTTDEFLKPTGAIDINLRMITGAPRNINHNMLASVHTGSNEFLARVRLLDRQQVGPGESAWAQLKLDRQVVVVKGDYFIIRSGGSTLGGGTIIAVDAARHPRNHGPTIDRLAMLTTGTDASVLLGTIRLREFNPLSQIAWYANMGTCAAVREINTLLESGDVIALGTNVDQATRLVTQVTWADMTTKIRKKLESYHADHPLQKGILREELRSWLGMEHGVYQSVIERLQSDGLLQEEGPKLKLPTHILRLSEPQEALVQKYLDSLTLSPYSPPTNSPLTPDLLSVIVERGLVVKTSGDVVFGCQAYEEMTGKIMKHIHTAGSITIGDVRNMFTTSRKYALALLEYMDDQGLTQRVGDSRILR